MGFSTDEVRICYQWGFLGWALVYAALTWGRGLWLGAAWYACRAGELYWLLVAATGLASWAVQYAVASALLSGAPPYPACNNNVRASPDLAVWLLFHYTTLAVVHEGAVGRFPGWGVAGRRLAACIAVPGVLIATGNTTWAYAAIGAGFGVALGLLASALLLVVWAPRLDRAQAALAWTGAVHRPAAVPDESHLAFF